MDIPGAMSQGQAFHRAGDLVRAEQTYRAVLRSDPSYAPAWFLLGVVCQATGRLDEATWSLRRSIQLRADHAPTWNVLGVVLAGLGRMDEAGACFRRVLQIQPDHAEAALNLERAGQLMTAPGVGTEDVFEDCCRHAYRHCQAGRFAEAEPWFHQALAIRPDAADVLNDLGKALVLQSRVEEGAGYLARAIAVDPDHARAHLNLSAALFELERLDDAESAACRALALEPGNPSVHNNLGLILNQVGRLSEAERIYRDGLAVAPDHAELHANLANNLVMQGRSPEAQPHYRRALEIKPDAHSPHSNWLQSLQVLPDVTPAALAVAHREWGRRHAAPLRSGWRPHRNDPDPDRPLRLGFVSADLKQHPVGFFLVRTIEALRSLECETYCYPTGPAFDGLTRRFAEASTAWRPSWGMSDDDLADRIRSDGVDILFDLSGHTSRNRLMVFARKPAPVQITWAGYVGTTGLSAMDYLMADRFHVEEGTESEYVERILRLPDGYVTYDPPAYAPEVGPLPALERGFVTFGCLNAPAKLNPDVVQVWSEILRRCPDSRLLLRYRGLDDPELRRRYHELFSAQVIDPRRIDLEGGSPHLEMLASYGRVDIGLDPFPYSGGLTTCEALWMGIPVVTRPGQTFAGRHAFSHLSNVGLTETVARDLSEYVDIAVHLVHDLPRLAGYRGRLRTIMADSPLCDGHRLSIHLLDALQQCWREWCMEHSSR